MSIPWLHGWRAPIIVPCLKGRWPPAGLATVQKAKCRNRELTLAMFPVQIVPLGWPLPSSWPSWPSLPQPETHDTRTRKHTSTEQCMQTHTDLCRSTLPWAGAACHGGTGPAAAELQCMPTFAARSLSDALWGFSRNSSARAIFSSCRSQKRGQTYPCMCTRKPLIWCRVMHARLQSA